MVDPVDPNTITYTFDDVPENCQYDAVAPNPYEDLTFLTTPYLAPCPTPNGTMGFQPSSTAAEPGTYETLIQLPFPASAVSLYVWAFAGLPATLVAYDSSGAVLATGTGTPDLFNWARISVAGGRIYKVGLLLYLNAYYVDDLTVTYRRDPTNMDQCKDGKFAAHGFKNQGQCVRFVETGKDSR